MVWLLWFSCPTSLLLPLHRSMKTEIIESVLSEIHRQKQQSYLSLQKHQIVTISIKNPTIISQKKTHQKLTINLKQEKNPTIFNRKSCTYVTPLKSCIYGNECFKVELSIYLQKININWFRYIYFRINSLILHLTSFKFKIFIFKHWFRKINSKKFKKRGIFFMSKRALFLSFKL